MSLTRVTSVSASRLRTTGLTIIKRIFKSTTSISSNQYSSFTLNCCICSHRIPAPADLGRKLYKSTPALIVRPYHNNKGNLKDEDADPAINDTGTDTTDEVGRDKEISAFRSTAPGTLTDNFVPFEDQKRVIQDVTEQEWNPIPASILDPRAYHEPVNLERESIYALIIY